MLLSPNEIKMFDRLIHREGGYVDDKRDPGGETKYGISKRSYPDLDIANLTKEDARDIYARDYWRKFSLPRLRDSHAAEWILDWVVNSGAGAIKTIQRELGITADGKVGKETIAAIDAMTDPREILLWRLKFYSRLSGHPFMAGWINRLIELGL